MLSNFFQNPELSDQLFQRPKESAVHQTFWTKINLWGHINKYQIPQNLSYPEFQAPQKHIWGFKISDPQLISHS